MTVLHRRRSEETNIHGLIPLLSLQTHPSALRIHLSLQTETILVISTCELMDFTLE
jgi:hypothetical protein